jgi:serpin B
MVSGKVHKTMPDEPAPTSTAPAAAVPAIAAGVDAFGADIYRILAEGTTDTVFSPVSMTGALGLALLGARGRTAAEIAGVLHLDGPADTADGLRSLAAVLRDVAASGPVTFRAPNTAWVQSGLPVRPEFTAALSDAATLTAADFARAPEAARSEINRMIAEQTAGKITGLLPSGSITGLTRLVLASAVYLKAAWAEPFPEAATSDAPFYPNGTDSPALTVRMMSGTASRGYVRADGYQAVLLPYQGASLAMAVVLPDGPLAALRPAITSGGLGSLLTGTGRRRVTLSMPRFRLEAAFDLIPALRRLGINAAFGDGADFSGITEAEPLQISAVAHKAYVDVDEQGTEAAAATAVAIRMLAAMRSPPVTMVVDRPFLFAIIDTGTGLPLFAGQVSHPHAG